MSNKNSGALLSAENTADIIGYFQTRLIVQCGEWFIQKQKIRLKCQRADQCSALTHSAGQLGRTRVLKAVETIGTQHIADSFLYFQSIVMLHLRTQNGVAKDAAPFQQVILLRHKAGTAGANDDFSLFRLQQATYQGQQCGFAAAGWTDNRDKFTGKNRKRKMMKRPDLPVRPVIGITDILQFHNRFHRSPPYQKVCFIVCEFLYIDMVQCLR